MFRSTPCIQGFSYFFRGNPCLLAILWKMDEQILIKFSGQFGYKTRNNLEHFEDVADRFLFFRSAVASNIIQKRVNIFSWIFRICWSQHNKRIGEMFYAQLYQFAVPKLCAESCLLETLRQMAEWIFMKFTVYVGYNTRTNQDHFGDTAFNPLETGFLLLLDPYLLAKFIMECE